jgi:hypothetical protein
MEILVKRAADPIVALVMSAKGLAGVGIVVYSSGGPGASPSFQGLCAATIPF